MQFRRLETAVFRDSEAKGEVANFGAYVDRINLLLDNIEMRRAGSTFELYTKATDQRVEPRDISSGESELISLGIEVLMFAQELEAGKTNLLLLDSPDVHLHPDLQGRLMTFLTEVVDKYDFRVVLATHSTAILGGLRGYDDAAVTFMRCGDKALTLEPISAIHRRVLPVFGAHPLSTVFNEAPVLVVEGEADERVWQQAVRTSEGALKLYPVSTDGVAAMSVYETEVSRIVESVYDQGMAYSLRDGDGIGEELADVGPVVRLRLACRTMENLLLSDEVLAKTNVTWSDLKARMDAWIEANPDHERHGDMVAFRVSGYDRKNHDLKNLRMLLVGALLASTKPWEVLVGQAIGERYLAGTGSGGPDSLDQYLGPKAVQRLF